MKKLIIPIAAIVCAAAVSSARAQNATTNVVTFSATTYTQGTNSDNGTITTYAATVKASHATTGANSLLDELGHVLTGSSFPTTAKLILIVPNTNGAPVFAVINGANFYYASNIMSFSFSGNKIKAGTQADSTSAQFPERKTTQLQVATLNYDDTGFGGNLAFTLTGLATISQTDTAPVANTYTDTIKGAVSSMTGYGTSGSGKDFVATGSLTITGGGKLTVPVP